MAEPIPNARPVPSAHQRRREARNRLIRFVGLVIVGAMVVGAVVVRLGGGDDGTGAVAVDTTRAGRVAGVEAATGAELPPAADPGLPDDDVAASDLAPDSAPLAPDSGPAPDLAPDSTAAPESDSAAVPAPQPHRDPEPAGLRVPPTPPGGWAAPTEPSPITASPVPDSLRVPRPEAVHGVYIGSWSAGSRSRLAELLGLADSTEVNTFVIDIKDVTGEVSHRTQVPLAVQVEAHRRVRIRDLPSLMDTLRAHGIYTIARVVAFKDPLLAVARPEWSVKGVDGNPWEDDNGVRWVDSFNRNVWDYNIELAREAVALGFNEIQWDYVRFPDVPSDYDVEAVYPAQEGRSKTQAIREFLGYSAQRLAGTGVPVGADVFGITASTHRDIGIGQVWEMMSDQVDLLLPMVYPSHYPPNSWNYPNPNAAPYQIVRRALDAGVERSDTIPDAAAIRPWLQAFSLGEPEYGPMHIRAQIDATYDAGLTEWILWNPAVRYPREAFVDANGIEPWFAGMGEALYRPEETGESNDEDGSGTGTPPAADTGAAATAGAGGG